MVKGYLHKLKGLITRIRGLFASFTLQKQQPQQTKALKLEEVQNYNKDEDLQNTLSAEEHIDAVVSITNVLS